MKPINLLLTFLLIFIIFGCTNKDNLKEDTQKQEASADYPITEKFGEQIFTYRTFEIPVATGYPQLSMDELRSLSPETINESIDTYADLLNYLNYIDNGAYKNEANVIDVKKAAFILSEGEYEEVGAFNLIFENSAETYLYIKADGKYYPLDLVRQGDSATTKWLAHYPERKYAYEDLDEVISAVQENLPDKERLGAFLYADHSSTNYSLIDAPNGSTFMVTERYGEDMIWHEGYEMPLAYGLPKLSYDEIDALVKEADNGNYKAVRDGISTIPDFACFLKHYGFKWTVRGNIVRTDAYEGADVGNIVYFDDPFFYTVSGTEALMLKEGQCTAVSSMFQYVLDGDYDEYGYINILEFAPEDMFGYDGHVFAYIKTGNRYYLVNPADYADGTTEWMRSYDGEKASADSIDELMNYVYHSTYPGGRETAFVAAFVYDGLYARYTIFNSRNDPSKNIFVMPEGAELKVCLGCDYRYEIPKHPTTHDFVLGVKVKE